MRSWLLAGEGMDASGCKEEQEREKWHRRGGGHYSPVGWSPVPEER